MSPIALQRVAQDASGAFIAVNEGMNLHVIDVHGHDMVRFMA